MIINYPLSKFLKLGFTQTPPPVLVRAQPSRQSASPNGCRYHCGYDQQRRALQGHRTNNDALCRAMRGARGIYGKYTECSWCSWMFRKYPQVTLLIHVDFISSAPVLHRVPPKSPNHQHSPRAAWSCWALCSGSGSEWCGDPTEGDSTALGLCPGDCEAAAQDSSDTYISYLYIIYIYMYNMYNT